MQPAIASLVKHLHGRRLPAGLDPKMNISMSTGLPLRQHILHHIRSRLANVSKTSTQRRFIITNQRLKVLPLTSGHSIDRKHSLLSFNIFAPFMMCQTSLLTILRMFLLSSRKAIQTCEKRAIDHQTNLGVRLPGVTEKEFDKSRQRVAKAHTLLTVEKSLLYLQPSYASSFLLPRT